MYLTATSIKDYLDCPQKLEYRLHGEDSEPNAYFVRGIAVHEVLEDTTIQNSEVGKKKFLDLFTTLVNEYDPEFPARTSFNSMLSQSYKMLENYYKTINIEEPPIKETELFFNVEIGNIEFSGKIDQIRGKNVYDWKTTISKPDPVTLNADYQFTLYAMAYNELYGGYPENVYYGHLYSGNLYKMKRVEEDYRYLLRVADNIRLAAENNLFPRNYSKYGCAYCQYRHLCFDENDKVKY